MSVKFGLLALFVDGPKYGYQLRTEFEERTGGTWAVNVGQVYTTLERLERDGLVAAEGTNADGCVMYTITEAGRTSLDEWFSTPITDADRPRNELTVKLLMAATTPGVDVAAVVQRQRTESLRMMRDYTMLRRDAEAVDDVAGVLLLDSVVFALEGEVRWLDHVEATVLRRGGRLAVPARPRRAARSTVRSAEQHAVERSEG